MEIQSHTLQELNDFLNRVISTNLPELVWINAEIAQIGKSRGHYYIELVQKEALSNQIIAQGQAILWSRNYKTLKEKLGDTIDGVLQQGRQVLLGVKVDFSVRYGLKLLIENIDSSYTLGQLALNRERTINELKRKKLIGKNSEHILPLAMQRIAVISSERAAGYQDFVNHIQSNEYGYQIHHELFNAAMQGEATEREVERALAKITQYETDFDVVVIIRGGGAKLDLAAFDSLALSILVANYHLPVLTGIGHEIDEVVLDMVAHTPLKTPTAVADFLIRRLVDVESYLHQIEENIKSIATYTLLESKNKLQQFEQNIQFQAQALLRNEKNTLTLTEQQLPKIIQQRLKTESKQLEHFEKWIHLLSPEYALQRGFTMTFKNGKPAKAADITAGDKIKTHFVDGEVESIVD